MNIREGGFSLVELLVVISIMGVIAAGATSVVLATQRSEQYQRELQTVMDDARISMERIRKELRQARRVLPDSCEDPATSCTPARQLHFWVDHDQDNVQDAAEMICYVTQETTAGSGQYRLYRYTGVTGSCRAGSDPTSIASPSTVSGGQVLAETLVDDAPFTRMEPDPSAAVVEDETNNIEITLELEVIGGRGPGSLTFQDRVRLRNVA
jgi:prepilin-type N-terminal cleavage/methylation domain-containing protein